MNGVFVASRLSTNIIISQWPSGLLCIIIYLLSREVAYVSQVPAASPLTKGAAIFFFFRVECEDLPKSLKTTFSRAFIEEILWHIQRFEAVFGSFRRAVHFAHVPTWKNCHLPFQNDPTIPIQPCIAMLHSGRVDGLGFGIQSLWFWQQSIPYNP